MKRPFIKTDRLLDKLSVTQLHKSRSMVDGAPGAIVALITANLAAYVVGTLCVATASGPLLGFVATVTSGLAVGGAMAYGCAVASAALTRAIHRNDPCAAIVENVGKVLDNTAVSLTTVLSRKSNDIFKRKNAEISDRNPVANAAKQPKRAPDMPK